jgi:hypothetical protein
VVEPGRPEVVLVHERAVVLGSRNRLLAAARLLLQKDAGHPANNRLPLSLAADKAEEEFPIGGGRPARVGRAEQLHEAVGGEHGLVAEADLRAQQSAHPFDEVLGPNLVVGPQLPAFAEQSPHGLDVLDG